MSNLTRFGAKSKQDRDLLHHLEQDDSDKKVDLFLGEWGRILGESLRPNQESKGRESDSDLEGRNGWSE